MIKKMSMHKRPVFEMSRSDVIAIKTFIELLFDAFEDTVDIEEMLDDMLSVRLPASNATTDSCEVSDLHLAEIRVYGEVDAG